MWYRSRKPLPEMSGDVISISRLWEGTKMSETLIAELLRYCKTRYGIDLNESSGPWALLMAELCMLKAVVEAGRAAMQRWCQRLGDGFVGSRVTHGGVRFRFVGRREKAIHGLFGLITLARAYYAPVAGGGKGWVPLAERVGIGGGYTPGCQYFMAQFCAEQSYEQGIKQFHEVLRPDKRELVSLNKAFEMVREVGHGLEGQRQRELTERADEPVAEREQITGTMAVSIDAGKVATRANERITDEGKKKYDRTFRDAKVATVSAVTVDKEGQAHCRETSCVTGIEHADEFFPRIEVEMSRRSRNLSALLLVILGDGASWIWDRVADLAEPGQKVWYILDFWHACDHLAKIGKKLYGEGSDQFKACFERWRGLLWDGCVAVLIKELQDLHDSGRYNQTQCYGLQGEINYFTTNKQRMDYPLYRHLGLPIGSGVVESACKNVVAKRMKQSGMSWTLDGAKEMLQLRASVMSRRFWDDFEGLIPSSPPQEPDQTHLEAA